MQQTFDQKSNEFMTWWQGLPGRIGTTLQGWGQSLSQSEQTAWQSMQQTADQKLTEFEAWWRELPQKVSTALSGWSQSLSQSADTAMQSFFQSIQTKWQEVEAWWRDLPNKIKTALGDPTTWLEIPGQQIVEGLVKGMESAARTAIQKAQELARQIAAGFNSTQGANSHSPSRRMRDEAGKWLPLGVAAGMEKYKGPAIAQAAKLARQISSATWVAAHGGVVAGIQPGQRLGGSAWSYSPFAAGPGGSRGSGWSRTGFSSWGRDRWSGRNSGSVVAGVQMDELRSMREAWRNGWNPASASISFKGNTDSAFATAFMKLYRTGHIQIGR